MRISFVKTDTRFEEYTVFFDGVIVGLVIRGADFWWTYNVSGMRTNSEGFSVDAKENAPASEPKETAFEYAKQFFIEEHTRRLQYIDKCGSWQNATHYECDVQLNATENRLMQKEKKHCEWQHVPSGKEDDVRYYRYNTGERSWWLSCLAVDTKNNVWHVTLDCANDKDIPQMSFGELVVRTGADIKKLQEFVMPNIY
jgi:hypothetical protein